MPKFIALVLVFCLLVAPGLVRADQNDAALDGLFSQLQTTTQHSEAMAVEQAIWAAWIRHGDGQVDGRMSMGIRAMSAGMLKRSLKLFDQIVDIAPALSEGWNKRATVHYLLGNFEASVHDIQKTLALEPRHFGALSGMGLIYSAIGRDEAALKVWEKALSINPQMPGIKSRVEELRQKMKGEAT